MVLGGGNRPSAQSPRALLINLVVFWKGFAGGGVGQLPLEVANAPRSWTDGWPLTPLRDGWLGPAVALNGAPGRREDCVPRESMVAALPAAALPKGGLLREPQLGLPLASLPLPPRCPEPLGKAGPLG